MIRVNQDVCDNETLARLSQAVAVDPARDAIQQLDGAIADHPLDARLYLLRGATLASIDEHARARFDLSRATLLSPSLEAARFMLGQLEYTLENLAEARAIWSGFDDEGGAASAVSSLAMAMVASIDGDLQAAREHLRFALDRSPEDSVRAHIERLLVHLDTGDLAPTHGSALDERMPHFLVSDYLTSGSQH